MQINISGYMITGVIGGLVTGVHFSAVIAFFVKSGWRPSALRVSA